MEEESGTPEGSGGDGQEVCSQEANGLNGAEGSRHALSKRTSRSGKGI